MQRNRLNKAFTMRISILVLDSGWIARTEKRYRSQGSRANLRHVAYEVRDGRQRPAPDVHVRVHRQILVPHFDLGELYVHAAGMGDRERRSHFRTLESSAY